MSVDDNFPGTRFRFEPPPACTPDQFKQLSATHGFQFAAKLLNDAIACRADKLELNFTNQDMKLRLRVEGNWKSYRPFERAYGDALLAVLKQLALLNPQERRVAQRGSFEACLDHKRIQCLISSKGVPTGELVTIEIPCQVVVRAAAKEQITKPGQSGGERGFVFVAEVAAKTEAASYLVQCPHCSGKMSHDDRLAGQTVACPRCHGAFKMPNSQGPPNASQPPVQPVPEISDDDLIPAQRKVLLEYLYLVERCQRLERETTQADYTERGRAIMESVWNIQRQAGETALGILRLFPDPPSAPPKKRDDEFNLLDAVERFRLKRFPCVPSGPWAKGRTGANLLGLLESYSAYMQRSLAEIRWLPPFFLTICGTGFIALIFLLAKINAISRQDSTAAVIAIAALSIASLIFFFGLLAGLVGYMGLVPYRNLVQAYQMAVGTFDELEPLAKAEYEQARARIATSYQEELAKLQLTANAITEKANRLAPIFLDNNAWRNWSPSNDMRQLLRVGDFYPHPTKEPKTHFGAETFSGVEEEHRGPRKRRGKHKKPSEMTEDEMDEFLDALDPETFPPGVI